MAEISLNSNTALAAEGYFVLSWESDADSPLTLEQSSSADFGQVISTMVAADGNITITGLMDGDYYFRLLDDNLQQSNLLRIQVAHHSLVRALAFFSLGLVLFIILLLTIFIGSRKGDQA